MSTAHHFVLHVEKLEEARRVLAFVQQQFDADFTARIDALGQVVRAVRAKHNLRHADAQVQLPDYAWAFGEQERISVDRHSITFEKPAHGLVPATQCKMPASTLTVSHRELAKRVRRAIRLELTKRLTHLKGELAELGEDQEDARAQLESAIAQLAKAMAVPVKKRGDQYPK